MRILAYIFVAIGLLCIPFAAKHALAALTQDAVPFSPALYTLLASALLIPAGLLILRKSESATSTSRRFKSASRRIKIG